MIDTGAYNRQTLVMAKAEIELLRDIKRTCQCSESDQCMFARERDEARAEIERLQQKLGGKQAEIERLRATLRIAAGELSTYRDTGQHPQEQYDRLMRIESGELAR